MTIQLRLADKQKDELIALTAQFQKDLEDRATPPFPKAKTLQDLKEKLKAALSEQDDFEAIWRESQTQPRLLCLSHEKTEIRNLPWQIATEERPLLAIAKSVKKELSNYQPKVGFPLKVLIMVASPEGVTRLAYEEEELQLLRAFSPLMSQGLAQVHFTDDGSLENLEEKLKENKYHILHYSGHGIYADGKGSLALEDPITGRHKSVSALEFNQVLAKAHRQGHRPDLVVLSACQTAQGVAAGDLSGVADTLIEGGIPAVIAMAASILDVTATIFAAELYAELSHGLPLPDAFQEARLAIKKYELKLDLAKAGLAPGQWLIPQLLLNKKVSELTDKNAPKETLDFKNDVKYIKGEKGLLHLRVRPENYVFVGRRREKRIALRQLKEGNSILLRGQGGVGKTALAEHLAIRLLAANPKIKVFTFSEKTPAGQSLLDQMQNYLTKEKKDFKVVSELAVIPKQTDKFFHLLGKVSEQCDPVFLFDNIESFQKYDTEKAEWVWHQEKHEDVFQLIQILNEQTPFPLIITGRYPIAEVPELAICNMNTVPFGDFFRKCHQLGISQLGQKMRAEALTDSNLKRTDDDQPPTFEDIVKLLHKTFGGNYRALEFFDELYTQKGEAIFKTLNKLSDFENQLNEKQIREGVLTQMSENLIFEELLGYLNEKEKDTLYVLAQYNIPVLPMAIGMQRNSEDRTDALNKAVNLTLAERQTGTDGRERFYVMPLVRDLLKEAEFDFEFDEKVAGDYHKYIYDEDLYKDWLAELSEAFEWYFLAEAQDEINYVGGKLCDFYFIIQQFHLSHIFGLRTESIVGEDTDGRTLNIIGQIYEVFGNLDLALRYIEMSLLFTRKSGIREGEGRLLNNIGHIFFSKGNTNKALSYFEQALKIQKEIGDRKGESISIGNIANIFMKRKDFDTAQKYFYEDLRICQEIGDFHGEGSTLNNISQIFYKKGNYDKALSYLEKSLRIRQEIGDRIGESITINNLATIAHEKRDYNTALSYFKKSLYLSQELGDVNGIAQGMHNIGVMIFEQSKLEEAMPYLVQAYQIFSQIGSQNKNVSESYLTAILKKIGEPRFKEIISSLNQNPLES